MKTNSLRASTINTYRDCEWSYFLQYVVGVSSAAGKAAEIGTGIHLVLEILAKVKKTGHYKLKDKYCKHKYISKIVWKRMLKDAKFAYEPADLKLFNNSVQKIIDGDYNPFKLKILKTEQQFAIKINLPGFGKDKSICGTMDLVTEENKDTLHIIDYKTGKYRSDYATMKEKEWEDFFDDIQLQVYDIASNVLYKDKYKNIMLTIIFINAGGPFTITFNSNQRTANVNRLRWFFNAVESNNKPSRLKDDSSRKNQHFKCKYVCHFGKYEMMYSDSDGNLIKKLYTFKEFQAGIPKEFTQDKVVWRAISSYPETLCNKYHNIYKKHGLEVAATKIHELTIGASGAVSRRNDYTNNKISYGVLE